MRSSPIRTGLATVSATVIIEPGLRPSLEIFSTSGDPDARRAGAFAWVAINIDLTATSRD
ncbi:hypothetical protein MMOR_43220 [Mycolicibacterium moriokaense]|uniref:Uncharacterized protein n=1 Tax=Mycolicibacterium moriokaense TaxID=39691 RepID=A0AAD1HEH2_9MYCO|nr:hypothetical protein MMOR_43220 [Mycolicibacterium moriokaense]